MGTRLTGSLSHGKFMHGLKVTSSKQRMAVMDQQMCLNFCHVGIEEHENLTAASGLNKARGSPLPYADVEFQRCEASTAARLLQESC